MVEVGRIALGSVELLFELKPLQKNYLEIDVVIATASGFGGWQQCLFDIEVAL